MVLAHARTRFKGEDVTVVRSSPGGEDPYGDPLPGGTTEHTVATRVPVQPMYDNETTGETRGTGRLIGKRLYVDLDADILPTDHVKHGGYTYRIDGIAEHLSALRTSLSHKEVHLVRGEVGSWPQETPSSN